MADAQQRRIMNKRKRAFHAIVPDQLFVFHVRNDVAPRKGDLINEIALHDKLRGVTIVILVFNGNMAWGIGRCEWKDQFNKKLARAVATGRAKQAIGLAYSHSLNWLKQGIVPYPNGSKEYKEIYKTCRNYAGELIMKLTARALSMNKE